MCDVTKSIDFDISKDYRLGIMKIMFSFNQFLIQRAFLLQADEKEKIFNWWHL